MKQLFFVAALFFSINAVAQDIEPVAVYKDQRVDILLKKQAEVNNLSTRNSLKRRTAMGFRLLVISTNDRNEAIAARTKVFTYFPELKPYLTHQAPYFKITAGNFLTRAEAVSYQKRMASYFPNGVFVVNATVEVKPEDVESQSL